VTQIPDPTDKSVADAKGELARLGVEVEEMQAVLMRLMQDVARAESRLDRSQVARLVEVNEQLVVAAMTAQADADTAAQALRDAAHGASLDALTQLPSRTTLRDRFAQAVANAKRHGARFALLFLDLDDFKQFNDVRGHAFGDKVLRLAADRMRSVVREVDTVSRHGGDEFLVLLAELNQPGDAQTVAEKLIAAIGTPAELDGHVVSVTASVGIAIYPDDGEDVDTLIARADAAMYRKKRRRAGGIAFHGKAPVEGPGLRAQPDSPAHQTDRKTASEAAEAERRLADLREANEKLVLAVLTAQELQAAAERARQRQTALLAAVAEELRNPMAPIRIATTMLGFPPTDDPLLPHMQRIVERQLTHMARLIGNLVDAVNVDTGGLELDRRVVDMAQVIDRAVAAIRPMMVERGQQFDLHGPPGAIEVQGDAARLEQIVSNLLDNASRFTQDGGRISLSVVVTGDTLTLTVSDNGIGISPKVLPHLFEPFVQDDQALGMDAVGLGIGLTVARALAQAHGGSILAHSAGPSRGSEFVVTLPLAAGVRIAPAAGSASGEPDHSDRGR
jgi:diguanylate cyclase (GGDEF)-like protein